MSASDSSSRPLTSLFVTLLLNVSLMCVGILWLAGQFTTLMGWVAIGSGELTVQIGREGWLYQHTTGHWVSGLMESSFGGYTVPRPSIDNGSTPLWDVALADSQLTHPAPGLLLASGAQFRIVAFRHWLVFFLVLTLWLICQFGLPATRNRKSVVPSAEQD